VIFLDTNVFLRYLVAPTSPATKAMREAARALFESVNEGRETVSTTEVALHEAISVLASKTRYGRNPAAIAAAVRLILLMPGVQVPRDQKRRFPRAFDRYEMEPKRGFADAVVIASVGQLGIPLATFDEDLGKCPTISLWTPRTHEDQTLVGVGGPISRATRLPRPPGPAIVVRPCERRRCSPTRS